MTTGKSSEKYCPTCGTKLSSFFESGLVGCENCYSVFRREITPMLLRYHGADKHYDVTSKFDSSVKEEFAYDREYETLRLRYLEFIRAGNYDDADAVLSIMIKMERKQ